jgi:hypothetical protein
VWESDGGEDKICIGEETTGRTVSWVVAAGDILEMEGNAATELVTEGMDLAEDAVGCPVAATTIVPAVNDAEVIAVDEEVIFVGGVEVANECSNQELESNGFGPANFTGASESLPSRK